jgi:hypothetical protein
MRLVGPAQEASRAAVASGHVFGLCGDDLLLAEETARGTAEADLKRSTARAWGGPRRRSVGRCRGRAGSHGGRPGQVGIRPQPVPLQWCPDQEGGEAVKVQGREACLGPPLAERLSARESRRSGTK